MQALAWNRAILRFSGTEDDKAASDSDCLATIDDHCVTGRKPAEIR